MSIVDTCPTNSCWPLRKRFCKCKKTSNHLKMFKVYIFNIYLKHICMYVYIRTHAHTFFCSNTKYKIYEINTIYFHYAETKKKSVTETKPQNKQKMQSKCLFARMLLLCCRDCKFFLFEIFLFWLKCMNSWLHSY